MGVQHSADVRNAFPRTMHLTESSSEPAAHHGLDGTLVSSGGSCSSTVGSGMTKKKKKKKKNLVDPTLGPCHVWPFSSARLVSSRGDSRTALIQEVQPGECLCA